MMKKLLPAVFIVRDGILSELVFDDARQKLVPPCRPELLCLRRRAGSFLRELNAMGFLCLAIAGEMSGAVLSPIRRDRIQRRLRGELEGQGARLHGSYSFSYNSKEATRVHAETEVILEAATTHRVEMHRSFLIAHDLEDVIAGRSAGLATIWVSGSPAQAIEAYERNPDGRPDRLCGSLDEVLTVIRVDARVGANPSF